MKYIRSALKARNGGRFAVMWLWIAGLLENQRAGADAVTEWFRHRYKKAVYGLLADAEAGEDAPQQIVRRKGTRDFAQGLLSHAQVFGQ